MNKFLRLSCATFLSLTFISCVSKQPVTETQVQIENPTKKEIIKNIISGMTLDQKIGQLFVIRPGAVDPDVPLSELKKARGKSSHSVSQGMIEKYAKYPAGGFCLFNKNIDNPEQVTKFNEQLHALGEATGNITPFIFVDEEGGIVARLAKTPTFNVPKYESMAAIGATGNPQKAFEVGATIGDYLKKYGFDADFAPVADVFTNPLNTVIGTRAFSSDPKVASKMVVSCLEGLESAGIKGCVKHFPGHGDTETDSHYGLPETTKTWKELLDCEMVTFKAAIESGAQMIMTAHIAVPNVTGDDKPATVSSVILTQKLRGELGFEGVIITDGLEMDAVSQVYPGNLDQACVDAILAGVDILLMPIDYVSAFNAVKRAVENGTITEKRIDESLERILSYKM